MKQEFWVSPNGRRVTKFPVGGYTKFASLEEATEFSSKTIPLYDHEITSYGDVAAIRAKALKK